MLTLNDGRAELWQWDTGRTLSVDADCSQVHFSNKVFGRSIDVDVVDGVAIIPDILLQTDKDLNVWAFVGAAENGYTKISKTFKVNRRNKPADYVFTTPDQTSLEEIKERVSYLESMQDPGAIKNAVEDYLEKNPVEAPVQSVNGQTGEVELTAGDVGAISQDNLQEATNEALAQAKASGEFDGAQGADGHTPEYGVDYGTPEQISGIAQSAAEILQPEVNQLKNDLDSLTRVERSPNLFNKDDANITSNAQIRSDGTVAVNSAWSSSVTDFIKINANESRTLRQTLDTNIRIAEYKADGTFIAITTINSSSPMTLNDETEKIRIEFWSTTGLMVYQSDTKLPYEDYYVNILVNEDAIPTTIARKNDVEIKLALLDDRVSSLEEYEITNYMLFTEVYEGYNKYVDGVLKTEQWWKATSMVKLDKAYNMYSPAVNGNAVFFDENKEYISTVEFRYNIPVMKSAYPENAVYVAFSYQVDYMQSYNNVMYVIRTDNNNLRTRKFYPTTKKEVGKRPRIDIYTTDSQDAILWKLADAFLTRDCDVYFENGTYVFDDVFVDLKEKYEYANYFELPIGGNCRYYFNGSTLICNVDKFKAKGYSGTVDLLSCIESTTSESYELYDGTLINNGGFYVVHDECGGKPNWYSHRYKNMRFQYNSLDQTNNIRKCVGGGTGLFGESIFENCTFETDYQYDLSFHGIASEKEDVSDFKLVLSNCYLSKRISLDSLATNQTASLLMSGCSAKYIPQTGLNNKWDVKSWCNEVRTE